MLSRIVGCFFLIMSSVVFADFTWYPQDGTWRNPSQPGRNFKIDIQDKTLILNVFGYRQDGTSVWFQAAKSFTRVGETIVFDADLSEFKNGQCLGCPYTKPVFATNQGGHITITFTSPGEASVLWEGEAFNIERSNVVVGNQPQILLGTWVFSTQITSVFADLYVFTEIHPATSLGSAYGSKGMAVGTDVYGYDIAGVECYETGAVAGTCLLVEIDSSTLDEENTFSFVVTVNQVHGVWISDVTGNSYDMIGLRVKGKTDTLLDNKRQVKLVQESRVIQEKDSKKELETSLDTENLTKSRAPDLAVLSKSLKQAIIDVAR